MEAKKLLIMFWAVALTTFSEGGQLAKSNLLVPTQPPSFESKEPKSDVIKSAITNSGDQIASKLDKIVDFLQVSNQKTVEDSNVSTSQLANIWKAQEARFQELELKIQECRSNKEEDYQELAQRVFELETRLNNTIQENIDLRATVDILQQDQDDSAAQSYEKSSIRRRNPRMLTEPFSNSSNDDIASNEIDSPKKRVVAFDAYRSKPFDNRQSVVTFDNTSVNVGDAFDVTTGFFTAPYAGIYGFNFHALTRDGSATYVKIQRNEENVGGAYRRHEGEGDEMHASAEDLKSLTKAEGMLAQSVLLQLEKSDKVSVFAYHGNIRDGGWHYTHFTGYSIDI